jgi:exopolysaccharide production protein ExoQ
MLGRKRDEVSQPLVDSPILGKSATEVRASVGGYSTRFQPSDSLAGGRRSHAEGARISATRLCHGFGAMPWRGIKLAAITKTFFLRSGSNHLILRRGNSNDRIVQRRWVRWAVGWLFLYQLEALDVIDRAFWGRWLGKQGDSFTQFMNISQIIISITLFVIGSRRWPSLQKGAILSLCLAVFLLCSTAWSVVPAATLRGAIQYFFFILGLIGAAENIEGDDFMDLLASVCFLSAIASLMLLLISPTYASDGSDFFGIFSYKNLLGQAMALGTLACLHRLWARKRSRLSTLFMLLLMIFVALKSSSATSCLAILLFCVLGTALQLTQKGGASRIAGFVLLALLLLFAPIVAVGSDALFALIGKDPTLTGRTVIWTYVLPYIYQRPFLGWGYGAFWSTENPAAWEIANAINWFSPEAHNGILEILLSGGLVGAVWFVYLFFRTVRLSLRCMRYDSAMAITCLSCCVVVLVEGVSERVLVYIDALAGVFFICSFFCEQTVSRARRRPINFARSEFAHLALSPATAMVHAKLPAKAHAKTIRN